MALSSGCGLAKMPLTKALCSVRLTCALCTPSTESRAFSTDATQLAQVIPLISRESVWLDASVASVFEEFSASGVSVSFSSMEAAGANVDSCSASIA
ncbi:Uncharacterised protein [Vibrio cholerae]|uniref:Uncharacterized protein n=1 Tax=Vibrio cholerae TaxID=666 RepID=A0A655P431_VIBCL|nr:Uncharacterised protein [Vibrio cholerae]CRZ92876.1 Uncharacterised protein [Vibrio cholerae]CSA97771.1 Uncharacterised protein [Vibrio cholerae]CSB45836.1 Uncharacterised protein [Vibrio cholerae]CSC05061.1 Uncharacterised protein [Vibrio cholerae]